MSSRSPWIHYMIAILALIPACAGIRAQRRLAALPPDFSAEAMPWPVRIADIVSDTPAEARFLVQGHRIGKVIPLVSADRTMHVALVAGLSRRHALITLISGCLFWLVAACFFAPRARDPAARLFFWCCLLYGVAVCVGGVYFTPTPFGAAGALALLQIACLAWLPALFLQLTLIFPRPAGRLARTRGFAPLLYLAAAALTAWQAGAYLAYFHDPGPGLWRAIQPPLTAARFFMVGCVAAGGVLLFRSGRREDQPRLSRQARWLLTGFAVGISPYVFLRTLPAIVGMSSPLTPEFDRLLELAIPLTFVLAVAQQRLLDIDVILRRGLIYGTLAALFVGLYLLVGLRVGGAVGRLAPGAAPFAPVLIGSLGAVLYAPLRRTIGRLVDRLVFKIDYEPGRALAALDGRLGRAAGPEELARVLKDFLGETLAPDRSCVILAGTREVGAAGDLAGFTPAELLALAGRLSGGRGTLVAAPEETGVPEVERRDYPEALSAAGFGLLQPVVLAGGTLGALLVGRKRSERLYVGEDVRLLQGAAESVAHTLDRVNLVRAAAEEALERRQLREMDDAKNDFLSRVAHDLRTPLTAITWSAQNLLDGVVGPISRRQAESVDAIRASTHQLARLVNNLLEISRLEMGRAAPRQAAVRCAALLEEVALSLRDQAAARGIRIRVRCPADLRCVRADSGQLFQVVFNLLDNALKYSPPGGVVDLSLAAGDPGWQTLEVRDRGPGVPSELRERIFDRFVQGPASPHEPARGFGLGLWVVRAHLEALGGDVHVEDGPGGGARFICRLSEWAPELEAVT